MSDDLTKAEKISYRFIMSARGSDRVGSKREKGLWKSSSMTLDGNIAPTEVVSADQHLAQVEILSAFGHKEEDGDFAEYLLHDVERWKDELKSGLFRLADFFAEAGIEVEDMPEFDDAEKAALQKYAPKLAELIR